MIIDNLSPILNCFAPAPSIWLDMVAVVTRLGSTSLSARFVPWQARAAAALQCCSVLQARPPSLCSRVPGAAAAALPRLYVLCGATKRGGGGAVQCRDAPPPPPLVMSLGQGSGRAMVPVPGLAAAFLLAPHWQY